MLPSRPYPTSRGQLRTYSLVPYYPYKCQGEKNPRFNKNSGRILSVKDHTDRGHALAVKYFSDLLVDEAKAWQLPPKSPFSGPQVGIVIVPSSTVGKTAIGLQSIATRLCQVDDRFQLLRGVLTRTQSIPKAATGGPRSIEIHKNTITCDPGLLETRIVMLVDDVISTGSSMVACCELIQNADPQTNVFGLALGHTTHD